MDGPWGYWVKQNKPERERQMLYDFTHMWKINKHIDKENRLVFTRGEGSGGRAKGLKGHIYMMTDKNKTTGGEQDAIYRENEI